MYFKIKFIKNTTFFSLFTAFFVLFFYLSGFGNQKGSPYIQRITLNNYGFKNNNFSIIQDYKGIIYISNNNGLLQYDGTYWEIIKISGTPKMDLNSDGVLYIGGNNDFGLVKNNRSGKPQFYSLKDSLGSSLQFHQINQLYSNNKQIYFCTKNKLFRWSEDKSDNQLELLDSSKFGLKLFKVGQQIFLEKKETGLLKLIQNEFRLLPGSKFFNKKDVIDVLPFNKQFLIKTKNEEGFYLFDNYSLEPFHTEADRFIRENTYTAGCVLKNGHYAIGTALNGIVVINKKGQIQLHIDENSGLLNLSVNDLYADANNNLWALHNQGMSRIEIPSPYSYFNKNHGLKGDVRSVIKFKENLYVATSLGVFKLQSNSSSDECFLCSHFEQIKEIKSACYDFHQINNRLFVSTLKGIFEIIGDKAILFYNREADEITSVLHSTRNPSYIYLGYNDGFSAIQIAGELLIVKKKIEGIDTKIASIAEEQDGTIWLSSNESGVYKIEPFESFHSKIPFKKYTGQNKLPENTEWINLYALSDGVLFSTARGLFRFDADHEKFYTDTLIGLDFAHEIHWVYPIVEDKQGNLWLNIIGKGDNQSKTLVKNLKNDSLKTLRPLPFNRLKDFLITSIQPDEKGVVWFGGYEGLIRLDLNQQYRSASPFLANIHKIQIGKDSTIYQLPFGENGHLNKDFTAIPYKNNDITFEFSSNHYESEDQVLYQYKLEGFDQKWSNWTSLPVKEYTNLFEGSYIFKLKAKNIFDDISKEVTYELVIKPPIYRTRVAFIIYMIFVILLFVLIGKWRAYYFARERFRLENIIHERTEEVVIQKEKADNLLERVLPKTTAKELKSGKKAGPYHYNMVTVLFSDIQGFTKIAEQMDSDLLIDELDRFFLQFDTVVEKYNIEKIKTIGDAYMCAGGIPTKNRTNPVEVVLAAMEMQNFMKELKRKSDKSTSHIWDLRIGIDTGPVVAGVLGRSKISYDIWGGTVNTASRMEASGEPGKINITENTYMLIKDFFICQYRGKMPVKYKGEIDMYFVEGFMPHLSSDLKGQVPNKTFFTQIQTLRINDVEEFVLSKLEDGLPDNLYYHNVKHTIDVVTQAELIGRSEEITDEEMLMLKTAALFHDMGHLINYDTHEEESVKLAKKILPEYHYTEKQIDQICQLILATKMPPQPKNLLEEIMCDADLDYLGRTDFVPVSISLYKELAERKKIDSILEWNQMQLSFIKKHHYFTKTAQKLREVNKKKQLENIKAEINRELHQQDD